MRLAVVVLGLKLLFAMSTVLALYVVSYIYGAEGVASYGVVLSIVNIGSVVVLMGGSVAAVDNFHKKNTNEDLWRVVLILGLIVAAIGGVGYFVTADYRVLALIPSFPVAVFAMVAAINNVQGNVVRAVIVGEGLKSLPALGLIVLIAYVFGGQEPGVAIALSYIGIGVFSIYFLWVECRPGVGFKFGELFKALKRNFEIFLPMLLMVLSQQFDRVLLSYFLTSKDLASLVAAQTVTVFALLAMQASMNVNLTKISKVANEASGSIVKESRSVFFFTLLAVIVTIPVSLFYFGMIGVDIEVAAISYSVLSIALIASLMFGMGQSAMQFAGEKRPFLWVMFSSLMMQYVVLSLLFPFLGVYAAAIGAGFGMLFGRYLAYRYWKSNGVRVSIWSRL